METTMIQIKKDTAELLKDFKQYSKQSYDEVIKSIIQEVRAEKLTEKEKKDIEIALNDIRKGNVYRIEDVAKQFGVKLRS